jgi:nucleotide-binding universal stress UspA family protein
MNTLTTSRERTAGTLAGSLDRPLYAVVGFDGSSSSLRALDAAVRLLNDRPGGMEIVYVAHVPVMVSADPIGGAAADMLQTLDDTARDLSEVARARLQALHLHAAAQRWHFQRRNGAIADNLIAAADDLRLRHGSDAEVLLVVGRSEHGYHHVLGSVPAALERHVHHPVLIIP